MGGYIKYLHICTSRRCPTSLIEESCRFQNRKFKNPFIFPGSGDQNLASVSYTKAMAQHELRVCNVCKALDPLPSTQTKTNSIVLKTLSYKWCLLSTFQYFIVCICHSLPGSIRKLSFYSNKLYIMSYYTQLLYNDPLLHNTLSRIQ